MSVWLPDVELNDDIARSLIRDRFPDLKLSSFRFLGRGFDNHAYVVNQEIIFRIPHRQLGGVLMKQECEALRFLSAQQLALEIPNPVFLSEEGQAYPYPIAGYRMIVGETADSMEWSDEQRAQNAGAVGRFLRQLHQTPLTDSFQAGDSLRRADLAYRLPIVLSKLPPNAPQGFVDLLTQLAESSPWTEAPRWVHGDLYSRHLIAGINHKILGVIDWGDVHLGDPAIDLAIAWMFLPRSSWEEFLGEYGEVDPDTWNRARFRAMTHWVYLKDYGEKTEDSNLKRELEFQLSNVLS